MFAGFAEPHPFATIENTLFRELSLQMKSYFFYLILVLCNTLEVFLSKLRE